MVSWVVVEVGRGEDDEKVPVCHGLMCQSGPSLPACCC